MANAHHGNARPLAVSRYMQRVLNDWLKARPDETKANLARDIGISGAHVTNITKNGRGVGADVEALVAKWMGITVDELRRRAHDEFKDDAPKGPELQLEDRYRNRAAAVAFMSGDPDVEPEALALTNSEQLKSSVDPPRAWWVALIAQHNQRVKMEKASPQIVEQQSAKARADGAVMEAEGRPKLRRKA